MTTASSSDALFALEEFQRLLQGAASPGVEPPDLETWVPKRYGYRVGSFGFLVAEHVRSEVVRAPAISNLPHSPEWLLGLMNLRGNLVPVADLRSLCGESPAPRAPATVLVLDSGEKAIAIPIEDLPVALADPRPLDAAPHLPPLLDGHAGPAFEADDRIWLAFDHDKFFRALARGPGAQP
jgi:chemotaxis signal transduction protein